MLIIRVQATVRKKKYCLRITPPWNQTKTKIVGSVPITPCGSGTVIFTFAAALLQTKTSPNKIFPDHTTCCFSQQQYTGYQISLFFLTNVNIIIIWKRKKRNQVLLAIRLATHAGQTWHEKSFSSVAEGQLPGEREVGGGETGGSGQDSHWGPGPELDRRSPHVGQVRISGPHTTAVQVCLLHSFLRVLARSVEKRSKISKSILFSYF